MATRNIVFVRHSQTQVMPDTPSHQWPLSQEGKRRCATLARHLAPMNLAAVITSEEGKARETGSIVAQDLELPLFTEKWLHEHDRQGAPFLKEKAFRAALHTFFAQPQNLVFGTETAEEALNRFTRGVHAALEKHPTGNLAIVTHGTVLALYVARHSDWEAREFWERLGQPAYVRFRFPEVALAETAFAIV